MNQKKIQKSLWETLSKKREGWKNVNIKIWNQKKNEISGSLKDLKKWENLKIKTKKRKNFEVFEKIGKWK